ncbi:MAG: radical SAM/Cys-rich domain protein, partial [Gammaproteobacteria bacterium]|nr:radical SAM/Cys-rich domain protein [Gammaproteobacteria bacterium]
MIETLSLLEKTSFPQLSREGVSTLQVNLGYLCNQQCLHCHVNAGPKRIELMDEKTIKDVVEYLKAMSITTLDLTGGAPEMNPHFRHLVSTARALGVDVIDRCNLTILEEPGYEHIAEFFAGQQVQVMASLPCYQQDNVDGQRGKGVFKRSLDGLKRLNALGYGREASGLILNLVYNPAGAFLPPSQSVLEHDYKQQLKDEHGIEFNQLFTLANMPIKRFGSSLVSKGEFHQYMALLQQAHQDKNLLTVMCRNLISVDWQGFVYDCDFNQMLGLPLLNKNHPKTQLSSLLGKNLAGSPIVVRGHCYGCTAGQGS